MRPRTIFAASLMLTGLLTTAARAEDGYQHGRLRYVEPGVTLQRATDVAADEADVNTPFLPGDRVWTDASGRAEFQFPDGSLVRLDRRSKLDYAGHEQDRGERIVLRLWSGSLFLRAHERDSSFEVETPGGTVQGLDRSLVRVDVDAGEARVSVYDGEAVLDDGQGQIRLAAGERTYSRWGERAQEPERFDLGERDEFASWDEGHDTDDRWAAQSARYLPDELGAYSSDFDEYGDWRYETTIGYVWIPRVEVGWRPYWHGRWCWTPYGWTWVPNERWGWAPFHYGRWDYSGPFGWYWIPGRTWGPAWVSWAVGGGYVGWCPLGRHDRPVVAWGDHGRGNDRDRYDRGHAVPRGRAPLDESAWSVVRRGDLGRRDVARLRVPGEQAASAALRVADSASFRPTHDGLQLRQGAVPRAISTRPSPGDFVRELAVDNKTTIPSPWFRRGAVPRGDGSYGRGSAPEAQSRGTEPRESAARRASPRQAPWYAPTSGAEAAQATRHELARGLLDRDGYTIPIQKIQDTSTHFPIFGTIADYGNLVITTPGRALKIHNLPHPKRWEREIQQRINL